MVNEVWCNFADVASVTARGRGRGGWARGDSDLFLFVFSFLLFSRVMKTKKGKSRSGRRWKKDSIGRKKTTGCQMK